MSKHTTQGMQVIRTQYVGETAHGLMKVADVLARFATPEEAILYAGSRLVTLAKNNAKRAAEAKTQAQAKAIRDTSVSAPSILPKGGAKAIPAPSPKGSETTSEMNKRLFREYVAQGGIPGDREAWLAFKAANVSPAKPVDAAPAPSPKGKKEASPAQKLHKLRFAYMVKAGCTFEEAKKAIPSLDAGTPVPAPVPDTAIASPKEKVVTFQTVKAKAPDTRTRSKAVPAPVVEQDNVRVEREAKPSQDTSDAAILDWILAQPDPVKVGMRDLIAQFPQVSNNRKLAAIKAIRELAA